MFLYYFLLLPILLGIVLNRAYGIKPLTIVSSLLIVTFLTIFLSKLAVEHINVSSKEYWGSMVNKIEYYEEWNEWVTETCYSTCCCDSKGNNCKTTNYDCSHSVYHSPSWSMKTTSGEEFDITKDQYEKFKSILKNSTFVDLHRDYYTINGNEYYSYWNNDSLTAVPITTYHTYENRIKATDQSIFHFEKVNDFTQKKFKIVGYPEYNNFYLKTLIGVNNYKAQSTLEYYNGLLGTKKQGKIIIIVYNNVPYEASIYQKWKWQGGNKNEFIVCIGINKNEIKWSNVISWTTNELLKVEVNDSIKKMKNFDILAITNYVGKECLQKFERRHFKDFSYLTVEPSMWQIIITIMIIVAVNIATSIILVKQQD